MRVALSVPGKMNYKRGLCAFFVVLILSDGFSALEFEIYKSESGNCTRSLCIKDAELVYTDYDGSTFSIDLVQILFAPILCLSAIIPIYSNDNGVAVNFFTNTKISEKGVFSQDFGFSMNNHALR